MVRVCVVGCLHGELDKVYEDIANMDRELSTRTELVLCCGDFQSLRNPADLHSMSVPAKFYRMGDFYRYYSEEVTAPIPTVFVGGNHEASCYLQELPYGGWVAPNIWYMGYAGVVQFAGLRIAGLSGIYKQHDYPMGHFERPPYSEATKRSVYHLRSIEVFRLGQLARRVDIVLSHDWPRGIYNYGETKELLQRKRHFYEEVNSNTLGSPPGEQLLCRLRPRYWFSAHLHCKFAAVVAHSDPQRDTTKFLALDKCLPSRDYLQFLDIDPSPSFATYSADGLVCSPNEEAPLIVSLPPSASEDSAESPTLCLDPEWLCVLRATNDLMSLTQIPSILPGQDGKPTRSYVASTDDLQQLWEPFAGTFSIPENFERTAPAYKPTDVNLLTTSANKMNSKNHQSGGVGPNLAHLAEEGARKQQIFSNPQTELICAMLELINPNALHLGRDSYNLADLATRMHPGDDEEEEGDDACERELGRPPANPTPSPPAAADEDVSDGAAEDSGEDQEGSEVEAPTFVTTPNTSLFFSMVSDETTEEYDPTDPSPNKRSRPSDSIDVHAEYENPEEINLNDLVEGDEEEKTEDGQVVVDTGDAGDLQHVTTGVSPSKADKSGAVEVTYQPRPLSQPAEAVITVDALNTESEYAYQP
ncbi:unnamed protein product [Schistocephalus solidus]|uniref:Lariat debranching enzyme A n=2 Tax=Schistocephalus solidus TaxID=70667 RepID=A0A183S831_SCHSO|nr:unnamed protein product [Schistocephalus solidus]